MTQLAPMCVQLPIVAACTMELRSITQKSPICIGTNTTPLAGSASSSTGERLRGAGVPLERLIRGSQNGALANDAVRAHVDLRQVAADDGAGLNNGLHTGRT
jgi:hypothetical protein